MSKPVTRELAADVVHGIGIPLYLRDGRLYQKGPGDLIEPKPSAGPQPHSPNEFTGERKP